jgi:poly(A) polymerase
MIRAVKFSTKLQLTPEPGLLKTIADNAALIQNCSPARLVEELFKILRSGYAAETMEALHRSKLMANLMPVYAKELDKLPSDAFASLRRTDKMIRNNELVSDALLLCAMLYPALASVVQSSEDISKDISAQLTTLTRPMRFTKAHRATVRNVLISLRRMCRGPINKRNKRILQRDFAFEALKMLEVSDMCNEQIISQWKKYAASFQLKPTAIATFPARRKKSRRPRQRAKRLYRNTEDTSAKKPPTT